MIGFDSPQPNTEQAQWKYRLDRFADDNRVELAALVWGMFGREGDKSRILGIDLKPTPHFVSCPLEAIETLNRDVDNQLQEILGLVDGHDPDREVLILGIGDGQIVLLDFEPDPPPPTCFERVSEDLETLFDKLELRLVDALDRGVRHNSNT